MDLAACGIYKENVFPSCGVKESLNMGPLWILNCQGGPMDAQSQLDVGAFFVQVKRVDSSSP